MQNCNYLDYKLQPFETIIAINIVSVRDSNTTATKINS